MAALYTVVCNGAGSNSTRPASLCNVYLINDSYSFVLIQGYSGSYAGIQQSSSSNTIQELTPAQTPDCYAKPKPVRESADAAKVKMYRIR